MDNAFWQARWTRAEIGFHQATINPYLQRHWSSLKNDRECPRILVPCCGKSMDISWLAEQGAEVIGIELSHLAVASYFAESGQVAEVEHYFSYDLWQADNINIFCGDLFTLSAENIGPIDAVFDRGALIAMPEGMRTQYCQAIRQLTAAPAIRTLLITLDYPAGEMDGPPFSVTEDEVRQRYSLANVNCLERQEILDNENFFRDKGLSRLTESAYLIRP